MKDRIKGPRIVITGMGIVSSIGNSLDEVVQSLREGRSGIVFDEERAALGFRSALTGRIENFIPRERGIHRKQHRTMCEPALYAMAATMDAVNQAGLKEEHLKTPRCGVVFGNDSCVKPSVESIECLKEHGETHFIGAGNIFRSMNSTINMNIATHLGVEGANWTVSAACASGSHVIGQAMLLIRSGLQDRMIVGGGQETNWQSMASFDALGVFSTRHDAPKKASRPFDADRDGLVPSGGGACLVLETLEEAEKRGASPLAEVLGYGFSSGVDTHLSEPNADKAALAMEAALADGGVAPEAVDYINAHATSTLRGDLAEALAIARVLGLDVPVSSTKSLTGHECWMAGTSEVIYTVLMARAGFIAPNLNFTRFDEECPRLNIIHESRPARIRHALSNSFGFGGTNAVILLRILE